MTAEQLAKANELQKKIASSEETLTQLRATNKVIDGQGKAASLTRLTYHQKGDMAFEISINPNWFNYEGNKADFQATVKATKDIFIKLFEKDLQMMKDELSAL